MTSRYPAIYESWRSNPQGFWAGVASSEIDWFRPWDAVFDPDPGVYGRWFAGAECNTCWNCVDRHAGKRPDETAIIYDSPVTGAKRRISYAELLAETEALAAVMRDRGVEKGDRVIVYMPMIPEALFAMLACARLGAVHSVVFGGFAAPELAARIDDAAPKLIVSASCGIEPGRIVAYKPLLDAAIERARHKPEACLIVQREAQRCDLSPGRDFDYAELVGEAKAAGRKVECVPVKATDPLYILYTSGTTGQPKGVVRDNGGHMVALKWSMSAIYGIDPGETYWAASDVGWVVGHSYIVYAPLLHGCTTVLYEGKPVGTPDAGAFWRVIAEHGVAALFTAPTAFRAIKKEDPDGTLIAGYDLSKFRTLFLAGERADPDTIRWAEHHLGVPVVDHWWQTETAWAIAANPVGLGMLPIRYGSPGMPMPGYDLRVLDDAGSEVAPGHARQSHGQAAAAARLPADLVECRPAISRRLSRRLPRPLPHRRCRLHRRGRLRLRDVAHRRHHQRRRPSALDRRDGGGAFRASRRCRMRRHRRRRCAEGAGALRLRGAEGGPRARSSGVAGRVRRCVCARRSGRSPPSARCIS